jgi:hypothetical protein
MLKAARTAATIICSMHWTLVAFPKARLACSDHPVVIWPLHRLSAAPCANELEAGLLESVEIFFPIDPRHLLLMTWQYAQDATAPQVGLGKHAMTANAFVVANAHAQWFRAPGDAPWIAKGKRKPISELLVPGYDFAVAAHSPSRAMAGDLARAEAAAPLGNDPISVVSVRSERGSR